MWPVSAGKLYCNRALFRRNTWIVGRRPLPLVPCPLSWSKIIEEISESVLSISVSNRTGKMAELKTYNIHKLNGQNYLLWKMQMEIYMAETDLEPYILGTTPRPEENEEAWVTKDKASKAFLMKGLELDQLKYLVECRTAAQMWSKLQKVYAQKGDQTGQLLLDRFINAKMGNDKKVSDLVANLQATTQQLFKLGFEQNDPVIIAKILGSLPDKYNNIRSAWYAVPKPQQTVDRLTEHLINEETLLLRKDIDKEVNTSEALNVQHSAINLNI